MPLLMPTARQNVPAATPHTLARLYQDSPISPRWSILWRTTPLGSFLTNFDSCTRSLSRHTAH
jgi:hypothetical protein